MNQLKMFVRLLKVNEANRTVEGIIANEAVDHAGEVFDYDTSSPFFKAWSENMHKVTDGLSVGNLRAMHGNVVAGKLNEIHFDDVSKAIEVVAEVVDENEWQKVLKGCYTGFSIGGKYGNKWDDPALGKKRYTGIPTEVSLVDMPCNPDAMFTVNKADGATEMRKYIVPAVAAPDAASPATAPDAPATAGPFADTVNKRIPLDTDVNVRAAWEFIGGTVDSDIRKAVLAAFTERFGAPQAADAYTPAIAKFDAAMAGVLTKIKADDLGVKKSLDAFRAATGQPELQKNMYDCSSLCCLFRELGYIVDGAQWETEYEGDNSKVPKQLVTVLRDLGDALIAMVSEEVGETVKVYSTTMPELFMLAKPTEGLEKSDTKGGAPVEVAADVLKKSADYETLFKAVMETLGAAPEQGTADLVAMAKSLKESLVTAQGDLAKAHTAIHEQNSALLKMSNDNAALKKRVTDQLVEIDVLKKTPPAAQAPMTKAIGKDGKVDEINPGEAGTGAVDDGEPVMKRDGSGIDPVATAIKKAHAQGGVPLQKKLGS